MRVSVCIFFCVMLYRGALHTYLCAFGVVYSSSNVVYSQPKNVAHHLLYEGIGHYSQL